MIFVEIKSLAGVNYIRASEIIAVQFTDREKCNVLLSGGLSLPCTEPAAVVAERVSAALIPAIAAKQEQENADGDAGE